MAIPFKRMGRKDPRKIDGVLKYHPQLVTMGQSVDLDGIAYIMKDKSSLSLGDIQSVLTNYVEAMRAALFDGKSVNIRDFGVFSLSAHTLGATTKEECTVKNIKSIQHKSQHQHNKKLNHASGDNHSVRPNLTSTRAGDKIEFLDLEAPKKKKGDGSGEDNNPGGSGNEGGGGDEEAPDPTV